MYLCRTLCDTNLLEIMDSIKERLAHILRAKNLTATQFAEMMHIQPSNVSHLLSGRNKPSLDFLVKIKEIFPEYSFDWIILGKKPITVSGTNSGTMNTLFERIDDAVVEKELIPDDNISVSEKENISQDNSDTHASDNSSIGLKQIIYVYEDHTFEVLNIRK